MKVTMLRPPRSGEQAGADDRQRSRDDEHRPQAELKGSRLVGH